MHNIKNSKLAGATIEFEFKCELLAEDRVTDHEIREKHNDGVIDWKEFNRLIFHHRVYPLTVLDTDGSGFAG
ncbi:hypothetical protein M3231_09740 [Neobacillus mesonae]|nr:hypothetical protein [Neobacillus mesonae]